MGNDFDPRALAKVRPLTHLSGGAGVSAVVGVDEGSGTAPVVESVDLLAFPAGDSPTDAYYRIRDGDNRALTIRGSY